MLISIPIILFVYMRLVNPDYIGLLTKSPLGYLMLSTAIGMLGGGGLWMKKLVKVEF